MGFKCAGKLETVKCSGFLCFAPALGFVIFKVRIDLWTSEELSICGEYAGVRRPKQNYSDILIKCPPIDIWSQFSWCSSFGCCVLIWLFRRVFTVFFFSVALPLQCSRELARFSFDWGTIDAIACTIYAVFLAETVTARPTFLQER